MNKIIIFCLLILVIFIQYDILKPALKIGLTSDDWSFIFWYKLLGDNPLLKIAEVWSRNGPYTTVPLFYTGLINSLVGFNYQALQITSIFFKVLATLIVFPLVLIAFKNKLLAFLATLFLAMSYPSTGALETAVEPSEYLGMFFMGIFLILYCYVVQRKLLSFKWLGILTAAFSLAILMSVMRVYPLIILVPLIEIFLFNNHFKKTLKYGLMRILFLFSPLILITVYKPGAILAYILRVPSVLLKIFDGNWHLVLTPLQGIGFTMPFSRYWNILGSLNIEDFGDYIVFILGGPSVIFGLILLILAFFTARKPLKFFIYGFFLNFSLEVIAFFIGFHSKYLPESLRMNFDLTRLYSTLLGIFILVLSFMYWKEWREKGKNDNLLLALWTGPSAAFLFIWMTWMLADINLGFGGAQDHYLLIPEAGISIFAAGILVLMLKKYKFVKVLVPLVLILFYFLNKNLIYDYFEKANKEGRAAEGQIMMQTKFKKIVDTIDFSKPVLFYFETSDIEGEGRFYTESFLAAFPFWMHFEGDKILERCLEVLYYNSPSELLKHFKEENGAKGLFYRSLCVENGKGFYKDILYKPRNFYAYKFKNREFIDIKEKVLKELGLQSF